MRISVNVSLRLFLYKLKLLACDLNVYWWQCPCTLSAVHLLMREAARLHLLLLSSFRTLSGNYKAWVIIVLQQLIRQRSSCSSCWFCRHKRQNALEKRSWCRWMWMFWRTSRWRRWGDSSADGTQVHDFTELTHDCCCFNVNLTEMFLLHDTRHQTLETKMDDMTAHKSWAKASLSPPGGWLQYRS